MLKQVLFKGYNPDCPSLLVKNVRPPLKMGMPIIIQQYKSYLGSHEQLIQKVSFDPNSFCSQHVKQFFFKMSYKNMIIRMSLCPLSTVSGLVSSIQRNVTRRLINVSSFCKSVLVIVVLIVRNVAACLVSNEVCVRVCSP